MNRRIKRKATDPSIRNVATASGKSSSLSLSAGFDEYDASNKTAQLLKNSISDENEHYSFGVTVSKLAYLADYEAE